MKLQKDFFLRTDVVEVAKALIGKVVVTNIESIVTKSIIVETEAYSYKERGCHAYNYKNTNRTKTMFLEGGVTYVYLCYGVHELFNVVTNIEGEPEAVLIRAVQPLEGEDVMITRRGMNGVLLTSGPGKLTKAHGITRLHNGISLLGEVIWIESGNEVLEDEVVSTTRIGIDYAGEDALLPWRFYIKGNKYISKP